MQAEEYFLCVAPPLSDLAKRINNYFKNGWEFYGEPNANTVGE